MQRRAPVPSPSSLLWEDSSSEKDDAAPESGAGIFERKRHVDLATGRFTADKSAPMARMDVTRKHTRAQHKKRRRTGHGTHASTFITRLRDDEHRARENAGDSDMLSLFAAVDLDDGAIGDVEIDERPTGDDGDLDAYPYVYSRSPTMGGCWDTRRSVGQTAKGAARFRPRPSRHCRGTPVVHSDMRLFVLASTRCHRFRHSWGTSDYGVGAGCAWLVNAHAEVAQTEQVPIPGAACG